VSCVLPGPYRGGCGRPRNEQVRDSIPVPGSRSRVLGRGLQGGLWPTTPTTVSAVSWRTRSRPTARKSPTRELLQGYISQHAGRSPGPMTWATTPGASRRHLHRARRPRVPVPHRGRRCWTWIELDDWITHAESLVGTVAVPPVTRTPDERPTWYSMMPCRQRHVSRRTRVQRKSTVDRHREFLRR
jgi:hypothetical protein